MKLILFVISLFIIIFLIFICMLFVSYIRHAYIFPSILKKQSELTYEKV